MAGDPFGQEYLPFRKKTIFKLKNEPILLDVYDVEWMGSLFATVTFLMQDFIISAAFIG